MTDQNIVCLDSIADVIAKVSHRTAFYIDDRESGKILPGLLKPRAIEQIKCHLLPGSLKPYTHEQIKYHLLVQVLAFCFKKIEKSTINGHFM